MTETTGLRERIATGGMLVAPGVYDALTARLASGVGFDALYMTGYGTAAARRGLPDLGLLTMTEMVENLRAIVDATGAPVIADADTGFGNAINVARTVQEYERAGAAALHIEDQQWPKRCGHMDGKRVVPCEEMVGKLRAALDARQDESLLVIARTDALAVEGWQAALERGHAYLEAGADVLFVEAPETVEQMEAIPSEFDAPCLINMAPRTPSRSTEDLESMGYAIAIFPAACLSAAIKATLDGLRSLRATGKAAEFREFLPAFLEFNEMLGASRYHELEERFQRQPGEE